jgi:WD40 repeat protein
LLASAQSGGLTRAWAFPEPEARQRRLPVEAVHSLARLSGDGRYVLPTGKSQRGSDLKAAQVFEVATGRPARQRLESGGYILDGAFSPDGRQVALLVAPKFVLSGRMLGLLGSPLGQGPLLALSAPFIPAVPWNSRNDSTLNSSTQPGQLQLWDRQKGERLFDPLSLPSEPRCLDYSRDGRTLAVICSGGELALVDPGTGRARRQWQARPASGANNWYVNNGALRISPDGRSVLTFGTETVVRVFDLDTGQPRYDPLQHQGLCDDVRFSPDGRLLSTASRDRTARVWELATGNPVGEPLRHADWVFTALFSPDGNYLLTAGRDYVARLWDWRTGRLVCPAFQHDYEVHAVAFTPDGRWVLTASDDKTVRVWESVTGKPVSPPLALSEFGLTLDVTPDGRHAVVGGFWNELHVFDLGDLAGDTRLDADDLVVWGELLAGQRVHEKAGVTNLTAQEWIERWRGLRRRRPDFARMQ